MATKCCLTCIAWHKTMAVENFGMLWKKNGRLAALHIKSARIKKLADKTLADWS